MHSHYKDQSINIIYGNNGFTLSQERRTGNKKTVRFVTATVDQDTCSVARYGASPAQPTFRSAANGNIVRSTCPSSLRLLLQHEKGLGTCVEVLGPDHTFNL